MKRVFINAVIQGDVTEQMVRAALASLGQIVEIQAGGFEIASAAGLTKRACLYISADESEPCVLVSSSGDTEGKELSEEAMSLLNKHGVCVGFFGKYPRADRYGAPSYANNDAAAAAIAADHGFVCAECLDVLTEDQGDDTCDMIWLDIALPEDFDLDLLAI